MTWFKRFISIVIVVLVLSGGIAPVHAQFDTINSIIQGSNLGKVTPYPANKVEEVIQYVRETNDPEVQYILGYMYQYGENIEPSDMHAQRWYTKSAKSGFVPAMVALGWFYQTLGNVTIALKWFKKAVETDNDAQANFELGQIYEFGDGVYPSDKTAFKYYTEAANQDHYLATMKVGLFYHFGRGIEADIEQAVIRYNKLWELTDDEEQKKQLDLLLSDVYMIVAEGKEGKGKLQWLEKAAEKGNIQAMISIAEMYRYGVGIEINMDHSIEWYKKAAKARDINAMVQLGYIYSNGTLDMDPDYCMAFNYYKEAAEFGSLDAAWNLGNFYWYGHCVPIDAEESKKWFDLVKKTQ